jgi:hypothetical protein
VDANRESVKGAGIHLLVSSESEFLLLVTHISTCIHDDVVISRSAIKKAVIALHHCFRPLLLQPDEFLFG